MRSFFFATCLFSTVMLHAQEFNGTWRGKLTQNPGGCFPVYFIEMQLRVDGNKVSGSSYHFSDVANFVKENFEGNYDPTTKTFTISELGVLTFHIPPDCIPCIKNYSLNYSRDKETQQLSGDWGGRMMNSQRNCPSGKISLMKEAASVFNEIRVDTGTVRIDFYDNAQIDGDTISVSVDNNVVVSHQGLTDKPITLNVTIDLVKQEHEVIMMAENEGSIPPNTALVIVTAGEKRYRLFLSSDIDQKKVLLRLIYEKPR
jgi:hypothetical protein